MNFPEVVSFTVTNACNLRCKMCGQWSAAGYMHHRKDRLKDELALADWKRLVDELAEHRTRSVLIRGGEPFLFPDIMELIRYINQQGIFLAIDTNGTMLKNYVNDIVKLGRIHLTISVDGPEEIHDQVRGVKGCFQRIMENIALLLEAEAANGQTISKSICFTISPYSYRGLGRMPAVARELGIGTITIVPYYYVPAHVGKEYERELNELSCPAFSWHGFHHEDSGVHFETFREEYDKYLADLGEIYNFPYLPLAAEEYRAWFAGPLTTVRKESCSNVEKLIDIQPNGDANFCVDFPDYTFGNVKEATIGELWNSERAQRFREYRRKKQLAVCYRCGAKYMAEITG